MPGRVSFSTGVFICSAFVASCHPYSYNGTPPATEARKASAPPHQERNLLDQIVSYEDCIQRDLVALTIAKNHDDQQHPPT